MGYEDVYKVNSFGDVINYKTGLKRKLQVKSPGYPTLILSKNGKNRRFRIYKLVAEAFIGERPKGFHINHIDGNKLNNHFSNLEYVTQSQNCKHAWDNGLNYTGFKAILKSAIDQSARIVRCAVCGKETLKRIRDINKNKFSFCCKDHFFIHIKNRKVKKTCNSCNKDYFISKCHSIKSKYCSRKCQNIGYKKTFNGKDNPNYRHGKCIRKAKEMVL